MPSSHCANAAVVHLAVVVGELDREVNVELGELSDAGLAVELLGICGK
jgi:hypothetical protein